MNKETRKRLLTKCYTRIKVYHRHPQKNTRVRDREKEREREEISLFLLPLESDNILKRQLVGTLYLDFCDILQISDE